MELYDQVLDHIAEIGEAQGFEGKARLKQHQFKQGDFEFAGTR